MKEKDLDTLLSQPLAEPPDDGFSAAILVRIAYGDVRLARIEGVAYGLAAAAVVAVLALTGIGGLIGRITPEIVRSEPLAIVAAALILTGAYLRWTWRMND